MTGSKITFHIGNSVKKTLKNYNVAFATMASQQKALKPIVTFLPLCFCTLFSREYVDFTRIENFVVSNAIFRILLRRKGTIF